MSYGCVHGRCFHGVRCAYHASLAEVAALQERGWAIMALDILQRVPNLAQRLGDVCAEAGIDMMVSMTGWDKAKNVPTYGIWAPRLVVAMIDTTMAVMQCNDADVKRLVKAAKVDVEFALAVDSAYKMGGPHAVLPLVEDKLRSMPSWTGR